jgi:hypothetical protein
MKRVRSSISVLTQCMGKSFLTRLSQRKDPPPMTSEEITSALTQYKENLDLYVISSFRNSESMQKYRFTDSMGRLFLVRLG